MKYILISGNPVDGFQYWGPFLTAELAVEFGANNLSSSEEWWVSRLLPAEDER